MMRNHCTFFVTIPYLFFGCSKVNEDCSVNNYPNAPIIEWETQVSGSEEESHGHFILTCSDEGYLQVGETGVFPSTAKILVVKTDNLGELVWKKEFGTSGNNLGNSAIETPTGYIICGAIDGNSALIKLDKSNGNQKFVRTVDNGGSNAFENIIQSPNGFIAVGYNHAEDYTNTFFTEGRGHITFLDTSGIKTLGIDLDNYLAQAYRIIDYNNDYYVSGLTENANDYGLIKLDSLGNILWHRTYGGGASDHCFGMAAGEDGSIFLTGHTLSNTENWDTYTIKIDPFGSVIWERVAGNPRGLNPKFIHDEAWDIKCLPDGSCIVVAGTGDEYRRYTRRCGNDGDNSNTWHIYLIKYDPDGNLEWQKTYGGGQNVDWAGEAIDLTPDGGAIIASDNGVFGFVKIAPF